MCFPPLLCAPQVHCSADRHSETAGDIVSEYLERIGGRQAILDETSKAARGKKRGRPSGGAGPSASSKRARGSHPTSTSTPPAPAVWMPPSGSWEDEIKEIDACEDEGKGKLVVYLNWKTGHKTKHDTSVIYKKCPQKVRRPNPNPNTIACRIHANPEHRCSNSTNATSKSSGTRPRRPSTRRGTASEWERRSWISFVPSILLLPPCPPAACVPATLILTRWRWRRGRVPLASLYSGVLFL